MRREAYTEVIDGLTHLSHFLDDPQLRQRMLYLCEKVPLSPKTSINQEVILDILKCYS